MACLYKSTGTKSKSETLRFLVEFKKGIAKHGSVTLSAFIQDFLTLGNSKRFHREVAKVRAKTY